MNNFLTLQFSSVTQYWVWLSATPWTDQCFQWIFLYHWWFYLLAGQGTLKSLNQRESSKASILWHSAFFVVHLSHPSMATETTIALTRWTFVAKVMSLIFNMLSRLKHVSYYYYCSCDVEDENDIREHSGMQLCPVLIRKSAWPPLRGHS